MTIWLEDSKTRHDCIVLKLNHYNMDGRPNLCDIYYQIDGTEYGLFKDLKVYY